MKNRDMLLLAAAVAAGYFLYTRKSTTSSIQTPDIFASAKEMVGGLASGLTGGASNLQTAAAPYAVGAAVGLQTGAQGLAATFGIGAPTTTQQLTQTVSDTINRYFGSAITTAQTPTFGPSNATYYTVAPAAGANTYATQKLIEQVGLNTGALGSAYTGGVFYGATNPATKPAVINTPVSQAWYSGGGGSSSSITSTQTPAPVASYSAPKANTATGLSSYSKTSGASSSKTYSLASGYATGRF